ncbi:MAG: fatty acid desaturase [Deltaproteobacteria bacterium]|nr:fatty acid desaturase [Deltaproteobacteria bacterium]MBW2445210.1 fatty acid desaturase [Deltaproteobacteria bacterium]
MNSPDAPDASQNLDQDWKKITARYAKASWPKALWQLANTVIPFIALWIAAWKLSEISWWLVPPASLLASGFLLRMFIIQHDAGHCSFSPSQNLNNWVGRVTGIFTLTPYAYWRRTHGIHHATNGDLDNRIAGDIPTITLDEYLERSGWGRFRYRLLRFPLVFFTVGPAYQFLIKHRFPLEGLPEPRWPFLRSALCTDVAMVAVLFAIDPIVGWQKAILVHMAIALPAMTAGVWFFFVQHNFETTYWRRHDQWDFLSAALEGSSFYQIPKLLNWLTGDIAVHHVHHLNGRIPNYRLREVVADHPALNNVTRMEIWPSFRCALLHLWDEETQRMVGFATAHERERDHAWTPIRPATS